MIKDTVIKKQSEILDLIDVRLQYPLPSGYVNIAIEHLNMAQSK